MISEVKLSNHGFNPEINFPPKTLSLPPLQSRFHKDPASRIEHGKTNYPRFSSKALR